MNRLFPFIGKDAGAAGFAIALLALLLAFGALFDRLAATVESRPADIEQQVVSPQDWVSAEVQPFVQWVVVSQDHGGSPFLVVDKSRARLFAFNGKGEISGSAPILLGARLGDAPADAETPAGRFVADRWRSALADGIVWLNERSALTLHRVSSPTAPGDARERLESDAIEDRRVSDGSLHVGDAFYANHLGHLRGRSSVIYVLPEVRPLRELFAQFAAPLPDPS